MMALVVLGAIVQALSGNLGGTVFHGGGSAGVVSKPACLVHVCTPQQRARRALFAKLVSVWPTLDADFRKGWETYAATHVFPNRLSVARRLTGLQCFLKYEMARSPDSVQNDVGTLMPSGAATEAPVIDSWSVSHLGPCTMHVSNNDALNVIGYLYATRHVNVTVGSDGKPVAKGVRGGRGATEYVGYYVAYGFAADFSECVARKYGHLDEGEWVSFRTYWCNYGTWPSTSVRFLAHVI